LSRLASLKRDPKLAQCRVETVFEFLYVRGGKPF
jgi:hypothetical protein